MLDKIEIDVTQDDIDNSSGYQSNENCPIARATIRALKNLNQKFQTVNVGGCTVRIDGVYYTLPNTFIRSDWPEYMVPITLPLTLSEF